MDQTERRLRILQLIPREPKSITSLKLLEILREQGEETHLRYIQRDLTILSTQYPLLATEQKPKEWSWMKDANMLDIPQMDQDTALI